MTRIAVIGSGGMLGHDLMNVLETKLSGAEVVGFTRGDLDITDGGAVGDALEGFQTVINAAAYTKVDEAETHEIEAYAVNAKGARNVAKACKIRDQRLIQVSTDYVFDGLTAKPYPENHPRNPATVYGKSKAAGEEAVLDENLDNTIILRTGWLYGANGSNFVTTVLNLITEQGGVSVVTDQIGQPTWSRDLAFMIREIIASPIRSGILHGTNAGQASWFDFARAIAQSAGQDSGLVTACTTEKSLRRAPRPRWTVLGHDEWAARKLSNPRPWKEAFEEAWAKDFSLLIDPLAKPWTQ